LEEAVVAFHDLLRTGEKKKRRPQISPLRFAPVEMTILFEAEFGVSTIGPRDCRSLGSPGFPIESWGFGQMCAVLFKENHISGAGESCEVGNPGTLGMTKERATVP
jgi:hypothetical protein